MQHRKKRWHYNAIAFVYMKLRTAANKMPLFSSAQVGFCEILYSHGVTCVGLLTFTFRRLSRQRAHLAFSPNHYSSSNDLLSQYPSYSDAQRVRSVITATKPRALQFHHRIVACLTHVREFHPIPLFSKNKNACLAHERGRAFATKAGAICNCI